MCIIHNSWHAYKKVEKKQFESINKTIFQSNERNTHETEIDEVDRLSFLHQHAMLHSHYNYRPSSLRTLVHFSLKINSCSNSFAVENKNLAMIAKQSMRNYYCTTLFAENFPSCACAHV